MINFLQILVLIFIAIVNILLLTSFFSFIRTKVPYVPSSRKIIKNLFQNYQFTPNKNFIDLGAGDGKVLFEAEKNGLIAQGYEITILPYLFYLILKFFRHSKIKIKYQNFLQANLKNADYIYCYLLPELLQSAWEKTSKESKKGTIFISNTFKLKDIKPFKVIPTKSSKNKIYLYKI